MKKIIFAAAIALSTTASANPLDQAAPNAQDSACTKELNTYMTGLTAGLKLATKTKKEEIDKALAAVRVMRANLDDCKILENLKLKDAAKPAAPDVKDALGKLK